MSHCLIGLGSNQGDRVQTLDDAVTRLARQPGVRVVAQSSWIETAPVGGPQGQPAYLNGAVLLETSLSPETLLSILQRIEAALGRRRDERWGPRTIDLDLLLYDEAVLATPSFVVPHPRMAWRRFVLEPAAEIAPAMLHPPTGWTIARLLKHLDTTPPYVAITGSIGAGKTRLARDVAARSGAWFLAEEPDLAQLDAFYRDPASRAREMELQFLEDRARRLAADRPEWADETRATVSDFWFDQSAAFARVWLQPNEWDVYRGQWEQLRGGVVRPRLVVLLEAPADELLRRIHQRGRACEQRLTVEQLQRIGNAIVELATCPDQGPVMWLADGDEETAVTEVVAAIAGMSHAKAQSRKAAKQRYERERWR